MEKEKALIVRYKRADGSIGEFVSDSGVYILPADATEVLDKVIIDKKERRD